MEKICTKCKIGKPLTEFFKAKDQKSGLSPSCKTCNMAQSRAWAIKNRDKHKFYSLKTDTGITRQQYEELFAQQDGVCAICSKIASVTDPNKKLAVDHNHKTGFVRGLLCHKCNLALGYLKDDVELFEKAIYYIKNYTTNLKFKPSKRYDKNSSSG